MKIQHSDLTLIFTCEASYPAKLYWAQKSYELDKAIVKLAKKFKGSHNGSGMGFGCRDNGFDFKTETDRTKFIKALDKAKKTLHVSKVFLSVYIEG